MFLCSVRLGTTPPRGAIMAFSTDTNLFTTEDALQWLLRESHMKAVYDDSSAMSTVSGIWTHSPSNAVLVAVKRKRDRIVVTPKSRAVTTAGRGCTIVQYLFVWRLSDLALTEQYAVCNSRSDFPTNHSDPQVHPHASIRDTEARCRTLDY